MKRDLLLGSFTKFQVANYQCFPKETTIELAEHLLLMVMKKNLGYLMSKL